MFQSDVPGGIFLCLLLCLAANNGERYDGETMVVQKTVLDSVSLGLPDTTAYVGKIFLLSLADHPVFGRESVKLKINEVDKTDIPDWLNYDSSSRLLTGVATSHNQGSVFIQVATVCETKQRERCQPETDVFQITVKYEGRGSQADDDSEKCEDETVLANLVLCVSPDNLTLSHKLHLISGMADFLSIPRSTLTILPSSGQKLLAVEKGYQIISAGPGSGSICDLNKNVELSWYLACSTIKHLADFDKILQHNINVGRIEKEIGQKIVGWYVASPNSLIHFQKRRRRQARYRTAVPTPVFSPVVPTRVVQSHTEEKIIVTSIQDLSSTKYAPSRFTVTPTLTETSVSSTSVIHSLSQSVTPTKSTEKSISTTEVPDLTPVYTEKTTQVKTVEGDFTTVKSKLIVKESSFTEIIQSTSSETRSYDKSLPSATISPSSTSEVKVIIATQPPIPTTVSPGWTVPLEPSESLYHSSSTSVRTTPPMKTSYLTSSSSTSPLPPTTTSKTVTEEAVGSGSGHGDTRDDEIESPISGMTSDIKELAHRSIVKESTILAVPTAISTDSYGILPTQTVLIKGTEIVDSRVEEPITKDASILSDVVTKSHVIQTTASEQTTRQPSETTLPVTSEDQLMSPSIDSSSSSDMIFSGFGSTEDAGDLASEMVKKIASEFKFSPVSSTPVINKSPGADFFFESESDQLHMSRYLVDSMMSKVMIDSSKPVEEVMESGSADTSGSGQPLIDDEEGSAVSVNVSAVLMPGLQTISPHLAQNTTPPLTGSSDLIYTRMSSTPVVFKEMVLLSTSVSFSSHDIQNTSGVFIPPVQIIPTTVVSETESQTLVSQEVFKPETTSGQFATPSGDSEMASASSGLDTETTTVLAPADPGRYTSTEQTTTRTTKKPKTTKSKKHWKKTTVPYLETASGSKEKSWMTTEISGQATFTTRPDMTWPPFFHKTSTAVVNSVPFLENPVDFISASLGKYFEFPVPRGVFYDIEDGDTRALKLSMTLPNKHALPPDFWLQLDSEKQVISGLPLTVDLDTSHHMMVILVAEDSGGLRAKDEIKLYVNPSSFTRFTHKFIMTFAVNFAEFMKQRNNLSFLLKRLSSYFGDRTPENILVMDIEVGSLVLSWSNTTLNGNICNSKAIGQIYHKLVRKDGKVRNSLNRHLGSSFRLKDVKYEALGMCAERVTVPPDTTATSSEEVTTNSVTASSSPSSGLSIWAQVVLPVMIALLLLLLILLIILLINRRRKRRQQKQKPEKPIFTNDRHPVIFPDELEGEDTSLKPKKPIVLPNDTNRSLSSSPRTTYYFEDDSPSDNASNTGTGSRTGSGRRKPKSPPPYYQPHSDPPPYRLPPPYLTNNSSTV